MLIFMRIVRTFLMTASVCFLLFGAIDLAKWSQASTAPEALTLQQWGDTHGTTNTHLKISEFKFSQQFLESKNSRDDETLIYVPLMLPNGHWPDRKLLIRKVSHPDNPDQWQSVYDLTEIEGVIFPMIMDSESERKLNREVRRITGSSRRGNVFVFSVGGTPPSPYVFVPTIILSVIVGVVCGIFEIPIWWNDWSKMVAKQKEEYQQRKQAEEKAKETFEI
ncbi:hypothetical protein [Bremerella alba]|uniref:Uncharacterized protein n=1 Tax=Bremerella alba TaxID=980252 RepID=A0A7V8V7Z9_9BACT|nr:hypothetical protein [Bremerella alba]MBA2116349.1 hypothetical protein [Bremerella alba]